MTTSGEVGRIRRQLRNAVEGGAWHGPAVREILDDMRAAEAARRVSDHVHSAWEIVLHVTTWLETVRRRLEGERVEPTASEDWPPVPDPAGDASWAGARERLWTAHENLQSTLEAMRDADLRRRVVGHEYDAYHMLHGVVQHTSYHAGQIAVLKKAVRAEIDTGSIGDES